MPFLPDDSTYIGDCKDCIEYPDDLKKIPCCGCDPIGGTNFWHPKGYKINEYEKWKENGTRK